MPPLAFAKFDPNSPDALLAECDRLGISPENCTELAILETRHHVPPAGPHDLVVETTIIPLLVGLGAAFVFGILAFKKITHTQKIM